MQPKDEQNNNNNTYQELSKQLFKIDEVNAVSVIADGDKTILKIATLSGKQTNEINSILQQNGIDGNNVIVQVEQSDRPGFFSPIPLCTSTGSTSVESSRYTVCSSGSCGAFIGLHGTSGQIAVLSAAHVMTSPGDDILVARSRSASRAGTEYAVVDYRDLHNFDIGLAVLNEADTRHWNLQPTHIVHPTLNTYVCHFGGVTGGVKGTVKAITAHVKFSRTIEFYDLIELSIEAHSGDSGAPVFDEKCGIIGLIVGGVPSTSAGLPGKVYCNNLYLAQTNLPGLPTGRFNFANVLVATDGTLSNCCDGLVDTSDTRAKGDLFAGLELKREIELQLHHGIVVQQASQDRYGEIITDDPKVSVATHYLQSFERADYRPHSSKDNKEVKVFQPDVKSGVWFFAIPAEYILKDEEMAGLSNQTPLLAINVSTTRKTLVSKGGQYKRTPCGTGTTVPPDPVPIGGQGSIEVNKECPEVYINYVLNDYGHLMMMMTYRNQIIKPWQKVVGYENSFSRKCSPRCTHRFERAILCVDYKKDDEWEWIDQD